MQGEDAISDIRFAGPHAELTAVELLDLLIATHAENTAGCAAFRRLDANSCELHHVFVRNQFRGQKNRAQMVEQLIGIARGAGYQIMRLETTTFMTEARALYVSLGFKLSDPYYEVPKPFEPFAVFMERPLENR